MPNLRPFDHEALDLKNNLVNELPAGIGSLTKLGQLVATNNRLRDLPDSIGRLGALVTLRCTFGSMSPCD